MQLHSTSRTISELLANARRQSGWTQDQLAEQSHVSVRTIRAIECKKILRPRHSTVEMLAQALSVSSATRLAMHASISEIAVQLG
jgi:transcriptional regulator with XRE-family HTH domain